MSLQIGALGSSPASLIHTWQQINLSTLFRRYVSLPLGIEIRSCECSYLHVSLHMNSPMCVHNVSSLEWGGKRAWKEMRGRVQRGVTLCLSKLEHLTPDRWLISHATRLPSQIIIWQYLESERWWFFSSSASLLWLGCDGLLQDARCRWWRGEVHLSGSDCPSSVQSRGPDLERRSISWSNH